MFGISVMVQDKMGSGRMQVKFNFSIPVSGMLARDFSIAVLLFKRGEAILTPGKVDDDG